MIQNKYKTENHRYAQNKTTMYSACNFFFVLQKVYLKPTLIHKKNLVTFVRANQKISSSGKYFDSPV